MPKSRKALHCGTLWPDRRVLELKFVEEATKREISRRLGIKESTVSSKVRRGRKLLDAKEREEYCYGRKIL